MADSVNLYRLWREAADAGLIIAPAHYRDPDTGELVDHAYTMTGPRPFDTAHLIVTDLEGFLTEWLARFYSDPAARAQAATQALSDLTGLPPIEELPSPWEYAARWFEHHHPPAPDGE